MHTELKLGDCGEVTVMVLRVPGRDGTGAYIGVIADRNGFREQTSPQRFIAQVRADLASCLTRNKIDFNPDEIMSLGSRLVYGGAWVPGALESQDDYDKSSDPHVLVERLINLVWANLPADVQVCIMDPWDGFPVLCLQFLPSEALLPCDMSAVEDAVRQDRLVEFAGELAKTAIERIERMKP